MRNIKKTLSMFIAMVMTLTIINVIPVNLAYAADASGITVTIEEDNSVTVSGIATSGAKQYYQIVTDTDIATKYTAIADTDKTTSDVTGAGYTNTVINSITEADNGKNLCIIEVDNASDKVTKAGKIVITYTEPVDEPVRPAEPVVTTSGDELEAIIISNTPITLDVEAAPDGVKNQYSIVDNTWVDVRANKVTVSTEGINKISFRAINTTEDALTSDVLSYTITVDTISPVLGTATLNKNTTNKTISLSLSATDTGVGVAKIEYKIDSGTWTIYSNPIVFNTVGDYNVVYRAVDKAGNISTENTQVVKYNTLALMTIPTVRMLDDTPNDEYIRFRLQDYNIELFDYSYQFVEKDERVDKSDWEYCSGATYMEIDEEGEWDLYIMVEYDDYSDYAKVATCVIDQTEPNIVKIIQPKANSKGNFNITVDARDELSRKLEYSFDGGKNWGSSDSKTYKKATVILPGDIQVRDEAGNIAESGFCGVVEMDGRKTVFTEDEDSIDSNITDKNEPVKNPNDDKNNGANNNTGSNQGSQNSGSLYKTKNGISINQQAVGSGYMGGYPDNTFRPDQNINRSELATILTRVFNFQNTGYANYTDVNGHWAANSINAVQSFNMFQTNGNYFMPDASVTRAEVAHAICQFIDTSNVKIGNNPYNDISGSSYYNDILAVTQLGIMNGYGSNSFGPGDVLTRAQVVTIINRLIGATGSGSSVYFSDVTTSHWAYNDIMLASR